MARKIDPYNLDPNDVYYLQDRMWMVEEYERQGLTEEMKVVRETERLVPGEPAPPSEIKVADMSLGVRADGVIDKPASNGVVPEESVVVDDQYEEWTKEDLVAEVDERNKEEGRTEPLSKSGTKAELAARLHEDDEA